MLFCDDSVVKGSKFVSKLFVMPGPAHHNRVWVPEGMVPHKHDFGEIMYFSGAGASANDIKADRVLDGEIEIWIGDEKHIITRSSFIFIPKGLMHGPIIYRRVNKPILEVRFANTPKYTRDMIEGLSIEGREAVDRAESKYGALIYDNMLDCDPYICEEMGMDETVATNYIIPKTVKGAFYMDAITFLPNPPKDGAVFSWADPHSHAAGQEYFLVFGTNAHDPENLGATMDWTANGKVSKIAKSSIIHTPTGTAHCPLTYTTIGQPTVFMPIGDQAASVWDSDPMTMK